MASGFPWLVGKMSETMGLGLAITLITCACYALVLVAAMLLRETSHDTLDA